MHNKSLEEKYSAVKKSPLACLQPRAEAQAAMKTFWMKQCSTRLPDEAAGQLALSSNSSREDTALQEWGRELCVLSQQDTVFSAGLCLLAAPCC